MFYQFREMEGPPWSRRIIKAIDTKAGRIETDPPVLSWHPIAFTEELRMGLWQRISAQEAKKHPPLTTKILNQTIVSFRNAQKDTRTIVCS